MMKKTLITDRKIDFRPSFSYRLLNIAASVVLSIGSGSNI